MAFFVAVTRPRRAQNQNGKTSARKYDREDGKDGMTGVYEEMTPRNTVHKLNPCEI